MTESDETNVRATSDRAARRVAWARAVKGMSKGLSEARTTPDLMTVGGRIAWARAQKGLSASKLARAVGRTRAAISLYEIGRNKPPTEMLNAMADVLGRDVRWLAFGDPVEHLHLDDVELSGPTVTFQSVPAAVRQLLDKRPHAFAGIDRVAILELDAPHFGLSFGDILLLLAVGAPIKADGKLYAISSTAGTVVVRSEPMIDRDSEIEGAGLSLLLTTGQGQAYRTSSDAIDVLGQVGGWLHRTP